MCNLVMNYVTRFVIVLCRTYDTSWCPFLLLLSTPHLTVSLQMILSFFPIFPSMLFSLLVFTPFFPLTCSLHQNFLAVVVFLPAAPPATRSWGGGETRKNWGGTVTGGVGPGSLIWGGGTTRYRGTAPPMLPPWRRGWFLPWTWTR